MDENNEELIEIKADENAVDFIEDDDVREFESGEAEIKPSPEPEKTEAIIEEDSGDEEFTDEDFMETADVAAAAIIPYSDNVNTESSSSDEKDDFEADIEAFAREEADEEIFRVLSETITMQTERELVTMGARDSLEPFDKAENGIEVPEEKEEKKSFKEKIIWFLHSKYKIAIVPAVLLLMLIIAGSVLIYAKVKEKAVREASEYIARNVNYENPTPTPTPIPEITPTEEPTPTPTPEPTEEPEVTEEPTETPTPTPEEKPVVNILLMGEENIDGYASRGRTDLIDILTINSENKSVSITSVLRDCLVNIPNYSPNKINAVYAIGGSSLVMDAFELNFEFRPDNYILVNFEGFEALINAIDGIDIELTAEEARYLNKTNYISKPEYRTVVEGMNHLNGNQALGYCRIRKVGTKNNEYSDFGRSARHREVLKAIFMKMTKLSFSNLKKLADNFLPYITTDLDADTIEMCINKLLDIGAKSINEYRIPVDGSYKTVDLRDMKVTQFNSEKNLEFLKGIVLSKNYKAEKDDTEKATE